MEARKQVHFRVNAEAGAHVARGQSFRLLEAHFALLDRLQEDFLTRLGLLTASGRQEPRPLG